MATIRKGGIGVIEEGPLKGRQFIIPSLVWVEKGQYMGGGTEYSQACLIHQKFVQTGECPECETEVKQQHENAKAIGLA